MIAVKAALFDLDGTLADSLYDLADSANYVLKTCGYPEQDIEDYKYYVGDGLTKLIERVLPPEKITGDEIERIRSLWTEYYGAHCLDKTTPYEGMAETLVKLNERGIKLGVVTNKSEELAVKIVNHLYGPVFDYIGGIKDGVPLKPDPFLANEALSRFNASGAECIFIGDTSVDMATAANAGCVPAGALWGFRTEDELRRSGAAYLLKEPTDLLKIIDLP